MQKLKPILTKISIWSVDHFHLLFRGAAENHLRLQKCHENLDGSLQCDINFRSYSDLKKYQKKLRTITVSLSTTIAMVAVAFVAAPYIFNPNKSSAADFQWTQSSWAGGQSANSATKVGNTTYVSKDVDVVASAGGISLALPVAQNVSEDIDADFSGTKTGDGFYMDGSGKLFLKKPLSATCGSAQECASGNCSATHCI